MLIFYTADLTGQLDLGRHYQCPVTRRHTRSRTRRLIWRLCYGKRSFGDLRPSGAAHSSRPFVAWFLRGDIQRLEQLLDGTDQEVAGHLRESFKALQKYLGAAARAEYVRRFCVL